jgi:hypothetical protein
MRQKLKGPETDTETAAREGRRRRQPQGKATPGKQELNRRRMGVGRDHRTASMKRGGRGTHP